MVRLAPSILGADFKCLGRQLEAVAEAGAEYIHLDVMDGRFVPNISFGMPVIKSLKGCTDKLFDVHMMVEDPGRYVGAMKDAGADLLTVHAEACVHLDRVISSIKEAGMKAGAALNPSTPVAALDCILGELDMVLIMSVNPGFGGQKLIPYTIDKIRALDRIRAERGLSLDIEVDGGVTLQNSGELIEAGTDILVIGSTVFCGDAAANVRAFLEKSREYER